VPDSQSQGAKVPEGDQYEDSGQSPEGPQSSDAKIAVRASRACAPRNAATRHPVTSAGEWYPAGSAAYSGSDPKWCKVAGREPEKNRLLGIDFRACFLQP
jgi:hypothetical protein